MKQETKEKVTASQAESRTTRQSTTCVMRVHRETRARIDSILERVNKKHAGKTKIRHDAIICYALDLLDERHFAAIRNKSLSNEDLFAMRYKDVSKGKSNLSWDDFLGLVMAGKVTFDSEG